MVWTTEKTSTTSTMTTQRPRRATRSGTKTNKLHLLVAVQPDAFPDFSVPSDLSDVCLKVGPNAREFHVNQAHLAVYSTYFRSMFNGNFTEASQEAIVLPEISDSAFEFILRMLYPERLKISGDKMAEKVLPVADYLGFQMIIQDCEKVLATSGYPSIGKLRLAHHYGLQHLECTATKELADYSVAKQVVQDPSFHSLDPVNQEFVMKKLLSKLP